MYIFVFLYLFAYTISTLTFPNHIVLLGPFLVIL